MIKRTFVLAICLVAANALADVTTWPGGIAIIDLGPAGETAPVVEFQGSRVLVSGYNERWQAVVGVPLDASTGHASLTLADGQSIPFVISEHAYKEQRLTVNKSYVSPGEEALARIAKERVVIDAALTNWRDIEIDGTSLLVPVDGPKSSSFGLRRYFNDEPRSPHKGMDIAATTGTVIIAPRAGVVTATGDFYFNGNTVLLDHGQGFVTLYCHLSKIDVEQGQTVTAGEPLGAVGATGRVTGAHLHFGTYLNGTAVDPALLLIAD